MFSLKTVTVEVTVENCILLNLSEQNFKILLSTSLDKYGAYKSYWSENLVQEWNENYILEK